MAFATPITPTIGAEIQGLDLRQQLDATTKAWVAEQLVQHKVIFFRDQQISAEQHLEFAQFEQLETHPVNPKDGFPELLVLHNDSDRPPADTAIWHSMLLGVPSLLWGRYSSRERFRKWAVIRCSPIWRPHTPAWTT